jgi:glutaredoxin 3
MTEITIFTSQMCGYCHAAKELLRDKGAVYTEVDVTFDPKGRKMMTERSGKTSVPQIFINDEHVGGCDELFALEDRGELDVKLNPQPA